jgi:hypothetical protein
MQQQLQQKWTAQMSKTTNTPKYPNAIVIMDIDGPDGNAFAIMGRVSGGT